MFQVGDLPKNELKMARDVGAVEVEDLIPLAIALVAAKVYVAEFLGADEYAKLGDLESADIDFTIAKGLHSAIEAAIKKKIKGFHLDKVGFARAVAQVVNGPSKQDRIGDKSLAELEGNFRVLFSRLSSLQRDATRDYEIERTSTRIRRARGSFLKDHPNGAPREDARVLFEEIEANLDSSLDAEELRLELRRLEQDFNLTTEISSEIVEYERFKEALLALAYTERRVSQEPGPAN